MEKKCIKFLFLKIGRRTCEAGGSISPGVEPAKQVAAYSPGVEPAKQVAAYRPGVEPAKQVAAYSLGWSEALRAQPQDRFNTDDVSP